MTQEELKALIDKYLAEELSEQEFHALWTALQEPGSEEVWLDKIRDTWENPVYQGLSDDNKRQEVLEKLLPVLTANAAIPEPAAGRRVMAKLISASSYWWAAAVILMICCAGGYYFFLRSSRQQPVLVTNDTTYKNDIAPGGNRALLTLSDGSTVPLDSAGNQLIHQGTTTIQQNNGQLQYKAAAGTAGIGYNTLTTPRGGQFRVRLPDGTRVWLNAASSIRYPTAFEGKERRVTITGEAYFEIAGNAAMPFVVNIDNRADVEVLGTHFNINAYRDEAAINTTLLEGKIRVKGTVLNPGQQASLAANGQMRVLNDVDTMQVVAWKEGWFQFHTASLQEVMRQMARWYDIEINYQGNIDDVTFEGRMQRDLSLTQVLRILEKYHVRFRIEGKTITVLPG
ncbi:FecR family protein [Chitinophaga tropicalis]|uniref:DUF4974 domain-containing protein n=1 Tax=Chitinophaga tropicalis TaxID=2683588 RepID=A0A7K1UCZ7_9BACT|nr:FecR domain-containing protein [Chitinophaga tropicalis]MVT12249.1 DUF4974 domain-containing protein [Chitinophaga tropicalis]